MTQCQYDHSNENIVIEIDNDNADAVGIEELIIIDTINGNYYNITTFCSTDDCVDMLEIGNDHPFYLVDFNQLSTTIATTAEMTEAASCDVTLSKDQLNRMFICKLLF